MFENDDLPHFKKEKLVPRPLDGLSGEELEEYLAFLASEKLRAQTALDAKSSFSSAADALFRK